MATLSENIEKLRGYIDQIIASMQERGVDIDASANFEAIIQRLSSDDPLLHEIQIRQVLAGNVDISEKELPDEFRLRDYAFYHHSKILSLYLPGCTAVGNYAFQGCSKLKHVTLSQTRHYISAFAFERCSSLTGLNGTTEINLEKTSTVASYAFRYCTSITTVVGANLEGFIGSDIFTGCTALTKVVCNTTTEGKEPSDFTGYPWGLPSGCVVEYGGNSYTIE